MNRTKLNNGTILTFAERTGVEFTIDKEIGRGASCIVYHAVSSDNTEHLLKEYYPKHLGLERDSSLNIVVTDDKKEAFDKGLVRFCEGCEKQKNIRLSNDSLKNFTCNVQGYYVANGTEYIDMTCFKGDTYNNVKEKSVYDLMIRMKTLTQVIGNYHKAGLLHLDIKPENIYVRPEDETVEDVMLFDFDSVIDAKEVKNGALSYTKEWAAPEQLLPERYTEICEATDLFAVGEIIFYQLFDRHSTNAERRSFVKKYNYNKNAEIFKNVNPRVYALLDELLSHTICGVVSKRYKSADELIKKIDSIIKIANPKEPQLINNLPAKPEFFVGRDNEIVAIHEKLQDSNVVFLSGIGGIGKSELAKAYAYEHKKEYDVIVFATYIDSISMLVEGIPVSNFEKYPEEKPEEFYKRKLIKVAELCNEKTLIIVDNLDSNEDKDIAKILEFNCKMIITTRLDFSDFNKSQIKLDKMEKREDVNKLFNKYYTKPLSEDEKKCVDEIIDIVDSHTMTVELLAKQMMAGRVRPEKMLEKIKEGGISKSGKERINSDKDGKLDRESTYNHIQTLFDLSMISDEEYDVLLNLSLIPCSGILAIYFLELCEAESFDVINELILEGWINHDRIFDRISLHPLIADTVISASNYNVTKVEKFIRNCHQYMEKNDDSIEHISKEVLITYLPHISKMLLRGNSINNNVCDFIVSGAIGYFEYGYLNEAIKNCLKLISLINSNSDISTYNKIDAYGKLSSLYNINGDFNNAFECNEEAIKICINEYGEKHELTANNYRLIGETCAELKDYKKAEKYYLKALSILKKCPGDTSSYEVLVYNSIGVLYHLMGKYKEAVKYYLLAIENESNFEKDPHNLIITYVNLGEVYDELDMHEKAREYLSNAYNLSVRYYGEYHRLTSYACNQLGNHYNMQADYTYPDYVSAKEYFLKALEIRKKLFGEIHETTATSYSNLGGLFVMMGEYDEAEWYYNKALSIKRAIFGESEQLYAQYYGLALSLNKAELYDKALPYAIAALSLIDKIYDYPHKYTYHTLFVLGDIFAGLEKLDESIQYYKRAYDICLTLDEETDYFISGALYNVAEAFLNINALELAYLSIQESIKILNKSIDKNTYAFTIAFDLLGDILCENNDYIKAKEAYNRSLEQKLAFYGVNDEAVANAYYQLAFLSNKYEEYDEAVIYMEKCLQIRVELFGNNELVAKTYKNLAFIYAFKEDYDTAISKLEIAASIYSLCGDNYLYEKSEILECLGSFHIKCNHISTGVEYYKNTIDILEKLNIKEEKYDKLKKAIISLSKQE